MHQKLRLFLLLLVFNTLSCTCVKNQKKTYEAPYAEALSYAKQNLALHGTLVQQPHGYAYLKVDDRYIHELFPLLKAERGYQEPPYFRRKDAPGAHISVVYKDENVKLKEVGQQFNFTLKNIIEVHPKKDLSYIVLQVEAPELEELRTRYKLKRKLRGQFHISIAKKGR